LGTKLLPKLKSGDELKVGIDLSVTIDGSSAEHLLGDLRQILNDLGIADQVHLDAE